MSDDRRARYVALYATEARSLLNGARRSLVRWQDNPADTDPAEEIFRALHTIKGMAASLDFAATAERVHAAESSLSEVRRGDEHATTAWLRRFEQALDEVSSASEEAIAEAGGVSSTDAPVVNRGPRIVRVDLDRLDALLGDLGALVTARQELERRAAADAMSPVSRAATLMAGRLDSLQDRILDVRLAPLGEVFERIPALVRDVARQLGKEISVDVSGDTLEVDRAILDQLAEPLLHLLRNAVDHGIEMPEVRRDAGKRPAGRIVVSARQDGDAVIIDITDDGRGIDREAVARKARAMGILDQEGVLSDDGLLGMLERPGFSTAEQVTEISGRGVGLDVVVARMRDVGAALSLTTVVGHGTVFSLRLPTRLGIVRALVTRIGEERYVMALTHVVEMVPWERELTLVEHGRTMLRVHDELLPIVDLRRLMQYRGEEPPRRRPAVVFEANGQRIALLTDAVLGQVDAVVQPIDRPAGLARWINGATVLDDGRPALLMDLASVV